MREISDSAFAKTVRALEQYSKFELEEKTKDSPRLLLQLARDQDGSTLLKAVSEKDMGIFDRVASLFGINRFNLRRVVNFLQSDALLKKLDITPLEAKDRQVIEAALHSLDLKINKHRSLLPITPKNQTLLKTLSEHLQDLADRAKTSAYQLLKPQQLMPNVAHLIAEPFKKTAEAAKKGHFSEALESLKSKTSDPAYGHGCKELLDYAMIVALNRLVKELKKGKIIIDLKGNIVTSQKNHWFSGFKEFYNHCATVLPQAETKEALNRITNSALVLQEFRRAELKLLPREQALQEELLQELCKARHTAYPSRDKILARQAVALREVLDDSQLLSIEPEKLSLELGKIKQKAHFTACNIPEDKQAFWQEAANALLAEKSRLRDTYETQVNKIITEVQSRHLPQIAEARLIRECNTFVNESSRDPLEKFIKESISKLESGTVSIKEWKGLLAGLHTPEIIASKTVDFREKKILAKLHFYVTWQANLQAEMGQGFKDKGEVLGRGICWGVSLRWAIEELKRAPLSTVSEIVAQMEVGKTKSQDRYHHAVYKLSKTRFGTESSEVVKMKRKLGIQRTSQAFVSIFSVFNPCGKERIKANLKSHFSSRSFQDRAHGVAQLSFSWEEHGHAICCVFAIDKRHPEKSAFRFSDPNFGTFDFPVTHPSKIDLEKAQERFCDCLAELITTFYSKDLNSIVTSTFELKP